LADGDDIVAEVARAVGLAEGESGVRAVVSALARLEPVSIRRISRASGLPVPIVASVCGELRKRNLVAQERPAQLSRVGREVFAAGRLRLGWSGCTACSGTTLTLSNERAHSVHDVAKMARDAPRPRYDLDQCHCTVETKILRVLALHEADALVGRRILLLGDDDFVSQAIATVVRRLGSATTGCGSHRPRRRPGSHRVCAKAAGGGAVSGRLPSSRPARPATDGTRRVLRHDRHGPPVHP